MIDDVVAEELTTQQQLGHDAGRGAKASRFVTIQWLVVVHVISKLPSSWRGS